MFGKWQVSGLQIPRADSEEAQLEHAEVREDSEARQVLASYRYPRHVRTEIPVGRVLFLEASLFNHSCQPNCYVHRSSHVATVVALEPVQAGQELTISYIDEHLPPAARMRALLRDFFFLCKCPRLAYQQPHPHAVQQPDPPWSWSGKNLSSDGTGDL
ncbi:hypothetical protein WJX84_010847 [Apatococcus fuscideae]|uniref:SET domain-containing protein n=1 Tax=Apatococcus fuscideae TaxID=2026836 RepID=A0AAW1TDH1_9CHLO